MAGRGYTQRNKERKSLDGPEEERSSRKLPRSLRNFTRRRRHRVPISMGAIHTHALPYIFLLGRRQLKTNDVRSELSYGETKKESITETG